MFSYETRRLRLDRTVGITRCSSECDRRKPEHVGDERLHRHAAEHPGRPSSGRDGRSMLVKRAVRHDESVPILALDGEQQERVRVAVEYQRKLALALRQPIERITALGRGRAKDQSRRGRRRPCRPVASMPVSIRRSSRIAREYRWSLHDSPRLPRCDRGHLDSEAEPGAARSGPYQNRRREHDHADRVAEEPFEPLVARTWLAETREPRRMPRRRRVRRSLEQRCHPPTTSATRVARAAKIRAKAGDAREQQRADHGFQGG